VDLMLPHLPHTPRFFGSIAILGVCRKALVVAPAISGNDDMCPSARKGSQLPSLDSSSVAGIGSSRGVIFLSGDIVDFLDGIRRSTSGVLSLAWPDILTSLSLSKVKIPNLISIYVLFFRNRSSISSLRIISLPAYTIHSPFHLSTPFYLSSMTTS